MLVLITCNRFHVIMTFNSCEKTKHSLRSLRTGCWVSRWLEKTPQLTAFKSHLSSSITGHTERRRIILIGKS
jgi:hypothetical protein